MSTNDLSLHRRFLKETVAYCHPQSAEILWSYIEKDVTEGELRALFKMPYWSKTAAHLRELRLSVLGHLLVGAKTKLALRLRHTRQRDVKITWCGSPAGASAGLDLVEELWYDKYQEEAFNEETGETGFSVIIDEDQFETLEEDLAGLGVVVRENIAPASRPAAQTATDFFRKLEEEEANAANNTQGDNFHQRKDSAVEVGFSVKPCGGSGDRGAIDKSARPDSMLRAFLERECPRHAGPWNPFGSSYFVGDLKPSSVAAAAEPIVGQVGSDAAVQRRVPSETELSAMFDRMDKDAARQWEEYRRQRRAERIQEVQEAPTAAEPRHGVHQGKARQPNTVLPQEHRETSGRAAAIPKAPLQDNKRYGPKALPEGMSLETAVSSGPSSLMDLPFAQAKAVMLERHHLEAGCRAPLPESPEED